MKTNPLFKEKVITILEPNWKKVPVGTKFSGTIQGTAVSGRIQKQENRIYLCQDKVSGSNCYHKLGYRKSYCINNGTPDDLKTNRVIITKLTLDSKFKAPVVIIIASRVVEFKKGSITIGCTTVSNAVVKQIYSNLK